MYSWEINNLLEKNNWRVSSKTYCDICESPQIKYVKYEPFENKFHLATDDGYSWLIEVYL